MECFTNPPIEIWYNNVKYEGGEVYAIRKINQRLFLGI